MLPEIHVDYLKWALRKIRNCSMGQRLQAAESTNYDLKKKKKHSTEQCIQEKNGNVGYALIVFKKK